MVPLPSPAVLWVVSVVKENPDRKKIKIVYYGKSFITVFQVFFASIKGTLMQIWKSTYVFVFI